MPGATEAAAILMPLFHWLSPLLRRRPKRHAITRDDAMPLFATSAARAPFTLRRDARVRDDAACAIGARAQPMRYVSLCYSKSTL